MEVRIDHLILKSLLLSLRYLMKTYCWRIVGSEKTASVGCGGAVGHVREVCCVSALFQGVFVVLSLSFRNRHYANSTELSKLIWHLKVDCTFICTYISVYISFPIMNKQWSLQYIDWFYCLTTESHGC